MNFGNGKLERSLMLVGVIGGVLLCKNSVSDGGVIILLRYFCNSLS